MKACPASPFGPFIQPLFYHPAPFLPRSLIIPARKVGEVIAVREGWLDSGGRSRWTDQWVKHLGGGAPTCVPSPLPQGARAGSPSLPLVSLQGQPTLLDRAPARPRGRGTGPSAGAGAGRQQPDPSIAPDMPFLCPSLAASLGPRSASRPSLTPAQQVRRRSHARPRPAPMPMLRVLVEKGKTGDWDSYPPSQYDRRGNFYQISFSTNPGKKTPPWGWDPQKNFNPKIRPALPGSDLSPSQSSLYFLPWLAPLCGPWWGCEWPCAP